MNWSERLFVVRMITRAKWERTAGLEPGALPADIVADLRTTTNALSFWEAESLDVAAWGPAAVALAAGRDSADKLDLVFIERSEFAGADVKLVHTPGDSPTRFNDRHYDAVNLSLGKLVLIAQLCNTALQNNQYVRCNRSKVVDLIANFVSSEDVDLLQLKGKLAAAVGDELERRAGS